MKGIQKKKDLLKKLTKLKTILDSTPYLKMGEFCEKEGIAPTIMLIMRKGGIVENLSKGKNPKWKWNSIEPNMNMIDEIYKRQYDYNKNCEKKRNSGGSDNKKIIEDRVKILSELKVLIDYDPTTSIGAFSIKRKIRKTLSAALFNLKIVKGQYELGNRPPYKWIGGEPDADMAYLVWQEIRSIENKLEVKRKGIKPKIEKIESKELSHYESKILFGLVTLKLKPVFK